MPQYYKNIRDDIVSLVPDDAVDILEIGCGEVWTLRYLYKAFVSRKAEIVNSYTGMDIDPACLDDWWTQEDFPVTEQRWFKTMTGGTGRIDLDGDDDRRRSGGWVPPPRDSPRRPERRPFRGQGCRWFPSRRMRRPAKGRQEGGSWPACATPQPPYRSATR